MNKTVFLLLSLLVTSSYAQTVVDSDLIFRAKEAPAPVTVEDDPNTISAQIGEAALAARERVGETQAEKEYAEGIAKIQNPEAPKTIDDEALETTLRENLKPLEEFDENSEEQRVATRSSERWQLHKESRFETMYERFFSPLQKQLYSYQNFFSHFGRPLVYHDIEPISIACQDDVCLVKVRVHYFLPTIDVPVSAAVEEMWFKEGDEWYYYFESKR